jgi:hypothetical protein
MIISRLLIFTAVLNLIVILPGFSQEYENTQSFGRESLRSLDGVVVKVVTSRTADREGISRRYIRSNTELQLRKAGVEVYGEGNLPENGPQPELVIDVSVLSNDKIAIYNLRLKLYQYVKTVGEGKVIRSITYSTPGRIGAGAPSGLGSLNKEAEQEVKIFINDWLATHN